ncbi:hypothetical protein JW824_05830 [bacterium]|nr:hypothetical protein [bacterium]RQV95984.1 MAG: hypothetical protein EH221_05390 [bacterium]
MYKFRSYLVYLIFTFLILQNAIGGTILSSMGVGYPYSFPHTRSLGMGGVSIAVQDDRSISRINPANMSGISSTSLSIQYFYELNNYKDHHDAAISEYGNFDGFVFILPFGSGLSISGGLLPLTRIDYHLSFDNSLNDEPYIKSIQGEGGLNSFLLSIIWRLHSHLSFGCSAKYLFGKIEEDWQIEYIGSGFNSSHDILSTKNWGYGITMGINYAPFPALKLGAIFSPSTELNNRTEVSHYLRTRYETIEGSIHYPQSWGMGGILRIWKNSMLGVDYERWNWSQFSIDKQEIENLRDTFRLALGFEFPSNTDPLSSYWSRIVFRLGISYQPYFVLDTEGHSISERVITVGFGLPFIMNNSQMDIALGYGRRGSLSINGLQENLFRLSISVSGGEKWFSQIR